MTMTKREQDLKFLRKSIYILRENIEKNRMKFLNDTREQGFEKFWNKRIVEINSNLLNLLSDLERFQYGLTRNIENIEKYGYELE